ncbi:MAG: serine/threonine protein kinase [Deltaproteobacteria bacterium]|nr:serine/threonine protein kinase [Deltaproteobacteria bacterium]
MEPITVELKPGAVLADTYKIIGRIARGGWGVVYEARHSRLSQRRVAIKVLRASVAQRPVAAERFRREAEICSRLNHPHIVSVTDWNVTPDGSPFFVMEFLKGENLYSRMSRVKIPRPQVYQILQQAVAALSAAHSQGIIHRDLKPSNVFLVTTEQEDGWDEHVKILDFGISKIMSDHTLQLTDQKIIGTPGYMSPEQSRGKNDELDNRSDQFSLGVIAYEMFSGKQAFKADTVESMLYKVVHEEPQALAKLAPDLPANVIAAVRRAMSKDPDQRFPSISKFFQELQGCEAGPPEEAVPAEPVLGDNLPTVSAESFRKKSSLSLSSRIIIAGFAILALAAAGLAFFKMSTTTDGQVVAAADGGATLRSDHLDGSFETASGPSAPTADSEPLVALDGGSALRKSATIEKKPAAALRPEVADKLDEAEGLYQRGDYREAIRLANQAIGLQDVPRARLLVTSCYCAMGDLSNANASLSKLSGEHRKRAVKTCGELGMQL